jgi:hypothetical protein
MTPTETPDFTLGAMASLAAAPCSAICGNCTHYEPHRDSQTGRVHPSKKGRCKWKPNIKWAMAYRINGFGGREQDPMVYPVGVWKHTDAKTCACFSPNDGTQRRRDAEATNATETRTRRSLERAGSGLRPKNMAMTDDQLRARLNAIRKTAESLHGGGYSYDSGAPSEACWDVRFLLAHVDGLYAKIEDMAARITPNDPDQRPGANTKD